MVTLASQLFGHLVRHRNRGYDNGRLGVARLNAPVVSIGNISVGGTAKTPAVIALASRLRARGHRVDVLTRGYGRPTRHLVVVNPAQPAPLDAGDEPRLIARHAHAPVLVHADRFRAGLEGEHTFQTTVHLLDDGLQHRQLARNFELVMLDPSDLHDFLLPRGRLRETPAALARASAVVVLSPSTAETARPHLLDQIRCFTSAPIYFAHKVPRVAAIVPGRPLAFCGLARPESFWASLATMGIAPAARRSFPDHHRYSPRDLRHLRRAAQAAHADGYLTTEKDALNLPAEAEAFLHPCAVLAVDLVIESVDDLVQGIETACGLPEPTV